MKIIFFVCFTVALLLDNQAQSETLIASVIHNHKKNLSLNYNFDSIKFEKKPSLSRQDSFIEKSIETVQTALKMDKDKRIADTIKYFMSIRKDALISIGTPNYDLNRNKNDDNRLDNQQSQNFNLRQRGNRGFTVKILSIYF